MAGCLCEESTIDIFTRLPTKSLLRFRSLSKLSCSIISSPDFIRMHTNRHRFPQKLLIRHRNYRNQIAQDFITLHSQDQLPLCPGRGYLGITPVKFPYDTLSVIVGSCNGILCLYDIHRRNISLCNPSIRRKVTVPYCPHRYISEVHIGFGFDPITNDYKIVSISNSKDEEIPISSLIYSLKTGTWCEITSPTPFHWDYGDLKAFFVNGTLHWLVRRNLSSPHNAAYFYIMTFDLSSHVFGMIELPEPKRRFLQLTIIQDSLAVVLSMVGKRSIWVRRNDSWSLFIKSKRNKAEGTIVNVLQPSSSKGDLLFHNRYEGQFQVYNTISKLGYTKSILVDFTAASLSMVDMEMCSESLQLLDMGTA